MSDLLTNFTASLLSMANDKVARNKIYSCVTKRALVTESSILMCEVQLFYLRGDNSCGQFVGKELQLSFW